MRVASEKTQVLVLSQTPKDAVECSIKVAGETVTAGAQLKLLGVTLDRTLHFGAHCRNLRQSVITQAGNQHENTIFPYKMLYISG